MLPLSARPGPPRVIDGCASASTRNARTPRAVVRDTNVYRSVSPFLPSARNDPSPSGRNVAPAWLLASVGTTSSHAGSASRAGPPDATQASNRPGNTSAS